MGAKFEKPVRRVVCYEQMTESQRMCSEDIITHLISVGYMNATSNDEVREVRCSPGPEAR